MQGIKPVVAVVIVAIAIEAINAAGRAVKTITSNIKFKTKTHLIHSNASVVSIAMSMNSNEVNVLNGSMQNSGYKSAPH